MNSTLSVAEAAGNEPLSRNDFEKAKTGSSSWIPRCRLSIMFRRFPVLAKRFRRIAEVPASYETFY